MPSESYVALALRSVASTVETAEPLITAISGSAAVGGVLGLAWAMGRDESSWERPTAIGTVCGSLVGALLVVVDLANG
jgi:hypothetical protein